MSTSRFFGSNVSPRMLGASLEANFTLKAIVSPSIVLTANQFPESESYSNFHAQSLYKKRSIQNSGANLHSIYINISISEKKTLSGFAAIHIRNENLKST